MNNNSTNKQANKVMTISFHPRHYFPMVYSNLIEKMEDLNTVRQIRRISPTRLEVICKSKRGFKRVLHVIGHESRVMNLQVALPAKQRKFY